jgi:hypothetical protein
LRPTIRVSLNVLIILGKLGGASRCGGFPWQLVWLCASLIELSLTSNGCHERA